MWRLMLIGCAALALVMPVPAAMTERLYSQSFYAGIQALVTPLTNRTPLVWFDVLVIVVGLTVVSRSAWDLRRRSTLTATWRIVRRLITIASLLYLAFLVMWGLNYRRQSLREKLPFDSSRITPDAALALGQSLVDILNADYATAHQASSVSGVDERLAAAFREASGQLGLPRTTAFGRPKTSLLDLYFRRAGVAGMTDPFFLETLVSSDLLPFERPQVIAHEWAHLASLADEGEASFAGWLACMRGDAPHRYSGALALYLEVVRGLPSPARAGVSDRLTAGPLGDIRAMRERDARERSARVSMAGWRVYDSYLKINRIDAGNASYGEVVQLVLGTQMR